jgi:DNA helicase-2/ATP-dependent DNA helicase PcrA
VRELLKDSRRLKQLLKALSFAQASKQKLRDVMTAPKFSAGLATYCPIALAVQKRFVHAKESCSKLDFGDMLEKAVDVLDGGAEIPYTHVLVDEFQDGSAAQNLLLATLVKRGCQLMVFGDPEQAIYGFSGNSYTPLDQIVDGAVVMLCRSLTACTARLQLGNGCCWQEHSEDRDHAGRREADW